jgi:hypothetical protein
MNVVRTGMLLAALTALFLACGWLLGGQQGAMVALLIALGTNLFAYWNSDKMVLRMHHARPVSAASAPELYRMVETLARRAELPLPRTGRCCAAIRRHAPSVACTSQRAGWSRSMPSTAPPTSSPPSG